MSILKAACIQTNGGPEIASNLKVVEEMIREVAAQGAQFVTTPENTCHMRFPSDLRLETAPAQEDHLGVRFFADLVKELGIWLLVGSMQVKISDEKLLNRSFLFSDQGKLAAHYDKIHLFDVDLPNKESYRESDTVEPGSEAVVAETPWVKMGLSICYDLRFAYLYRSLAQAGAGILTVPSAFSVPTGQAHWATLLRARAIETGSFVLAPGQTGEHENGRKTWGHSMIIGPWGEVLAELGAEPGIILADLNLEEVAKARTAIPALRHDRDYTINKG